VADCLPVSIIDPQNHVIANIHSGWRGAAQGITAATLGAMKFDPPEAFAFLGPSIRVCCFEVGEEVAAQFDQRFVDRTLGAKPHVDIVALTLSVLRERGFAEERIVDSGLCTRCDGGVSRSRGPEVSGYSTARSRDPETSRPLFHSYRRDKRSGRNLAIVAQ
jgi:copper oxidase (laccase) domain-containing protein